MGDNFDVFQENIRNSFSRARKDIEYLKKRLEKLEIIFNSNKNNFSKINNDLEELKGLITSLKEENNDLNEDFNELYEQPNNAEQSQTIPNNAKQSSTIINTEQSSTQNNHQHQTPVVIEHQIPSKKDQFDEVKTSFTNLFRSLTDREFSVFLKIYELEGQYGEVTYTQLADALKLTEMTIRGSVGRLLAKNLPLQKERAFNGKVSLFLKKDFHDLHLMQKLVRLRQNPTDQRTLFEATE